MANPSTSTKDKNSTNETCIIIESQATERSAESDKSCPRRQILHRVPLQLHENKNHNYNPVVLSLGPYHHNKSPNSKFLRVEKFKNEVFNIMLEPAAQRFFRNEILERVDEIGIFYEGVSIDDYKEEELAEMMLRDTCFVLYYMEKLEKFQRRLGWSVAVFLFHDIFMLENQIPLWVLNILISLKFDKKDEGEAFLCKFLSIRHFMDCRLTRVPWEDKDQERPLHLLEAIRKMAVKREISSTTEVYHRKIFEFSSRQRKNSSYRIKLFETIYSPFRSVTDLKIKGIHFGLSSLCLTDIRFNSYWFYGKLQLPIANISNNSPVFFSNVIALEMSPETNTDFAVLSYVNFMESLLESPKDVKELR